MKKIITLLFVVVLTTMSASAYDFMVDNIAYNINSDGTSVTVTNGGNYTGDIVISSSVTYSGNTYSVTTIGNNAFYNCFGLNSVTIANSVTTIGNYAFFGCIGLTSLTIPNSVTTIGEYAFSSCSGLTSIVVESGNTKYDSRNNCNAIIETATNSLMAGCMNTVIPNSVITIGISAFAGCTGLTSVNIPNSVTSIDFGAFQLCTGLTSVNIPNSVTEIGNYVFYKCYGLTSIVVENENPKYDSRNNCNAIIETATNSLIAGCMNTVIPNSVTSIGGRVFQGFTGLTSVTIPNSVTSIGEYAFDGCSGLTSVTIPNSVTMIGNCAFMYCTGLTSVTIGNSVATIGNNAFQDCTGLTSVTIPNSVTSIGSYTFGSCSGLTSIRSKILNPDNVSMGDNVFHGVSCRLYVPQGTKSIYRVHPRWKYFKKIEEVPFTPGDVNYDDECTASDVTALYNFILYNDESAIVIGDQNGDGSITSSDVTAVYNIILGL